MNVDLQAMYKSRNLHGSYTSQYWSCQEGADLNPSSSPYFYIMIHGNSFTGSGGTVINVRAVRELSIKQWKIRNNKKHINLAPLYFYYFFQFGWMLLLDGGLVPLVLKRYQMVQ